MSTNPENRGILRRNFENKKAWKVIFPVVASVLICCASSNLLFISDYGFVKHPTEPDQQVSISYQIPVDLSQHELTANQELSLAETALPEIRVSKEADIQEGEYGVVFQAGSTNPQELADEFGVTLESDRDLVYVMYSFVFDADRDSQSARITFGDAVFINFNSRAVSVAGFFWRQIRDGHDKGDIENLLMVFERIQSEDDPEFEELNLVAVAPKQHTNGFAQIPLNQLTINPDGQIVFNAQEEKNALSQNEQSCQAIAVGEYLQLIKVNGLGCYPVDESRPLNFALAPDHNVGESNDQHNPFAASSLLANFSEVNAWDEDPFGEGRAFFEWLTRSQAPTTLANQPTQRFSTR